MSIDLGKYKAIVGPTRLLELVNGPQEILAELCLMLDHLEPSIQEHMSAISSNNRPDAAGQVQALGAELVRYGFITRGLLWRPPSRSHYRSINLGEMVATWTVENIQALSYMADVDRDQCRGFLEGVFSVTYENLVTPFEHEMSVGWFRRARNRPKWQSFYAEGIVLSIMMDHFSKPFADS